MKLSDPDDPYEQEAERVTNQIMKMSIDSIAGSRFAKSEEQNEVNRKCKACEKKKEDEEHIGISRKQSGTSIAEGNEVTAGINDARGGPSFSIDKNTEEFMESRFGYDFSGVKIHTDYTAARSAESVAALAYTIGNDIIFGEGQYQPGTTGGRRLLAHELTHIIQQNGDATSVQRFHLPHGADPHHQTDETPKIAPTFSDLLSTIKAIIKTATISGGWFFPDTVNMDLFVQKAGGYPASKKIDETLGTHSTAKVGSMLNYRYLFTCRCGLIDMRHFIQTLYIANFASGFVGVDYNRVGTKKGREHELASESESRFGPEDTTSNALGAFTATGLAANPRPGPLMSEIESTLRRCDPIDFVTLSAVSKDTIRHHYGDLIPDPSPKKPGDMIPAHQNQTALPDVLTIVECGGKERSFPFKLDTGDPDRKTISERAFGSGSRGLKTPRDVREYVHMQRPEAIKALPTAEKLRLMDIMMDKLWIDEDDLDVAEVIYTNSTAAEQAQIKKSVDVTRITVSQPDRLKRIFR